MKIGDKVIAPFNKLGVIRGFHSDDIAVVQVPIPIYTRKGKIKEYAKELHIYSVSSLKNVNGGGKKYE